MERAQVIVILGATATGKSAAAIELAKRVSGEIISADSMQIYIGMDIGTAKTPVEQRGGIPHYMIDIARPDENYSVSLFQQEAKRLIDDIASRGKTPIVCGGTGLYLNSLLYSLDFETPPDSGVREALLKECQEHGLSYMHDKLERLSPGDAARIHPNDKKRILRRLEILSLQSAPGDYNFLRASDEYRYKIFGLTMERGALYEKINARVDAMLRMGLVNEVKTLYEQYSENLTSLKAIGYKEIIAYLNGRCTIDEAAEAVKLNTRRFAKRQLTWFNRDKRAIWLNIENYPCLNALVDVIIDYIKDNEGAV